MYLFVSIHLFFYDVSLFLFRVSGNVAAASMILATLDMKYAKGAAKTLGYSG